MPHMLSSEGPPVATGDINSDGLDDFYIGGAKYQSGELFIQRESGSFEEANIEAFKQDKNFEDVDAVFFDANNDGATDLYVVSGGNESSARSDAYQDRIYLNDGNGQFLRITDALPPMRTNGSTVAPADFDADGDLDLFVGSRSVPGSYGVSPNNYILQNDGNGRFRDITDQISSELRNIGMVTDAVWRDINGDDRPDLIIIGEWMPITVFLNRDGLLEDNTGSAGFSATHGWWNTIEPGDFDNDGDIDFLAGNLGLNSYFSASVDEPLLLYLKDFNQDGQIDPIIAYTEDGKEYPAATRDALLSELSYLRSDFRTYEDFAGQTMQQIFGDQLNDEIQIKKAVTFSSALLENKGDGTFALHELPSEVQFSPVFAISSYDFNGDGNKDALIGGNFHDVKPSFGGRYDAGYGWYLEGNGDGSFSISSPLETGFVVKGETRDIKVIHTGDNRFLINVARNDDELLIFDISRNN